MLLREFSDTLFVIILSVSTAAVVCSSKESSTNSYNYNGRLEFGNTTTKCSHWKYHKYDNSSCVCGDSIDGAITCYSDESMVRLLSCHCMTYSDNGKEIVVGTCPYFCENYVHVAIYEYTNLSTFCSLENHQNRQGQMCGQCLDDHSPSPYSYTLACAYCSDYKYNWIKYLLMAYLPLTVFYLIVVVFKVNALSPSMNAFILLCQITSCPALMSIYSNYSYFSEKHPMERNINLISFTEILATVYGIWNLDFFRMIYSPFCLHPSLSIIQIKCLEYAIAVYPLLLVLLTYAIIKLYEMLKLVQFLLKPVVWVLTRFGRKWNTSNSLIEAFATFILLSYVKIVNTSFDILMPVDVHNVSGKTVGHYLYYNGSMEYFGKDHLPYAILAIFMFATFNLVPLLLLCLYPCRCFQSCLNCCRLNSQVLRTFMDVFQGCYKFEPYDCRYWAAVYLLLRIGLLIIFAESQSTYCVFLSGFLLIPTICVVAVIRPYRQNAYNLLDIVLLSGFVQVSFSCAGFIYTAFDERYLSFVTGTFGIGVLSPPAYFIGLVLYKTLFRLWNDCLKAYFLPWIGCWNHPQ